MAVIEGGGVINMNKSEYKYKLQILLSDVLKFTNVFLNKAMS